jgi:hypothetical protein
VKRNWLSGADLQALREDPPLQPHMARDLGLRGRVHRGRRGLGREKELLAADVRVRDRALLLRLRGTAAPGYEWTAKTATR